MVGLVYQLTPFCKGTYMDAARRPISTKHTSGNPTIAIQTDTLRWHCLSGYHIRLFAPGAPDWPDLRDDRHAQLIKANPLRRVYHVCWQELDVYAKIYYIRSLADQIKSLWRSWPSRIEFDHLQTAQNRAVPAAQPIAYAHGRCQGKTLAILITESIGSTVCLEDLLYQEPPVDPQRLNLSLTAVARTIARLHCGGILHHDLHPGNFLLTLTVGADKPTAYITDLQNITVEPRYGHASVDPYRRDRASNLAMILAALRHKLTPGQQKFFIDAYLHAVLPHYLYSSEQLADYFVNLQYLADRHSQRLCRRRDRRSLRDSKYSRRVKLTHGWSARVFLQVKHPLADSPASNCRFTISDWLGALKDPAALIQPGRILKLGGKSTVIARSIQLGQRKLQIVAKHARAPKGPRRCWYALRRSRALRHWHRAHALIHRSLPTAWPLAALEHRRFGLLSESILLCEEISNAQNLSTMLTKSSDLPGPGPGRRQLARQLGYLLAELRLKGFGHRDCKISNIVVCRMPGAESIYKLYLVDLDGLRLKRFPGFDHRHEALVRLAASALPAASLTLKDFARTFKTYLNHLNLDEAHNPGLRRQLWQKLNRAAVRKAAQSRKNNARKKSRETAR